MVRRVVLDEHRISSLAVVDARDQLLGVNSDADLVHRRCPTSGRTCVPVEEGPAPSYVGDVMTGVRDLGHKSPVWSPRRSRPAPSGRGVRSWDLTTGVGGLWSR